MDSPNDFFWRMRRDCGHRVMSCLGCGINYVFHHDEDGDDQPFWEPGYVCKCGDSLNHGVIEVFYESSIRAELTAVVRGYNEFLSEGFNAYAGEDEFSRGIRHGFTLAQIHYLKVNAPLFGDIEEDNNG